MTYLLGCKFMLVMDYRVYKFKDPSGMLTLWAQIKIFGYELDPKAVWLIIQIPL
jgi:hypothetical protein